MTTPAAGWDSAMRWLGRDDGRSAVDSRRWPPGRRRPGARWVLDARCGSGEHAMMAAARGVDVDRVDVSPRPSSATAARRASAASPSGSRSATRSTSGRLGLTFDTVIDSGLFHVFDDPDRARYVTSLAAVLAPGGTCYLMCFSDRRARRPGTTPGQPGGAERAFSDGWDVADIVAEAFEIDPGLAPRPRRRGWPPSTGVTLLALTSGLGHLSGGFRDGPPRPSKGDVPWTAPDIRRTGRRATARTARRAPVRGASNTTASKAKRRATSRAIPSRATSKGTTRRAMAPAGRPMITPGRCSGRPGLCGEHHRAAGDLPGER